MSKLNSLCATLACAFAVVTAVPAVDAAAAVQDARPSEAAAARHFAMPKSSPLRSATGLRAAAERTVGFRNSYGKTVWVAVMRYDPIACAGYGDWQTEGWWMLAPGEEKRVLTTSNNYAAYYAKASDGVEWAGTYGPVYVYNSAFRSCIGVGANSGLSSVGMRLIDLRFAKPYHFVNLIP